MINCPDAIVIATEIMLGVFVLIWKHKKNTKYKDKNCDIYSGCLEQMADISQSLLIVELQVKEAVNY